jgi:anti-anti-sigma regulatory factor
MAMPELVIRLSGQFPTANLDRLLSSLAALNTVVEPTLVTVDLSGLEHISAPCVAVLVSALLDIDERDFLIDGSSIVGPNRRDVKQRLEDLDVLELLVEAPPTRDVTPAPVQGSRPCQRFSQDDDPGQVAQRLTDAMAEVCATDVAARNATWWALNEIAQNVVDHAESVGGAVGIAEVTRGGTELVVAISDRGVGVRVSLAANSDYRDLGSDLQALKTAIRPGVTSRSGPGGFGLFLTQVLLGLNGGSLAVRSGTARLETGATPSEEFDLEHMHGTLVTIRIRTDRPFSLERILDPTNR